MKLTTDQIWINKLLFPETPASRLFYHIGFWIFYVFIHLCYSLQFQGERIYQLNFLLTIMLYFAKNIPLFYIAVRFYRFLENYLRGIWPLMATALLLLIADHIFMMGYMYLVVSLFNLAKLTDGLQEAARMYFTPPLSDIPLFLTTLIGDARELIFLTFPITIVVTKFAISENSLRQNLQRKALRLELQMLKSQLSPDFIFSIMGAAYEKIKPLSADAAGYLAKASNILRFSLYDTSEEFVKLEKEIACLHEYVELESMRSTKRSEISFVQEGAIKPDHRIPTLLLITLVENAFKHGIHSTRHRSNVRIEIKIDADILEFIISNSKPVQSNPAAQNRGGGIGLLNLSRRLDLYFPARHKFEKRETTDEFIITLTVPLLD